MHLRRHFEQLQAEVVGLGPTRFPLLLLLLRGDGLGGGPDLARPGTSRVLHEASPADHTRIQLLDERIVLKLRELLQLLGSELVLGLQRLLARRQLHVDLLESQVLLDAAVVVIEQLLDLLSVILAVLELVQAGGLGLYRRLDRWIRYELVEELLLLLELPERLLGEIVNFGAESFREDVVLIALVLAAVPVQLFGGVEVHALLDHLVFGVDEPLLLDLVPEDFEEFDQFRVEFLDACDFFKDVTQLLIEKEDLLLKHPVLARRWHLTDPSQEHVYVTGGP